MILYNGKIYGSDKFYDAVIIEDSKIKRLCSASEAMKYIGNSEYGDAVDLKGNLVLPGFIDSHAHGGMTMTQASGKIDLSEAESVEECVEIIKHFISDNPDVDEHKGSGWQNPIFGEDGPPKELLDDICCTKPIVLKSAEGHALWANSCAIKRAGIDDSTPDPKGGVIVKDGFGNPSGTFKDEAQHLIERVIGDDTVKSYKENIMRYQKMMVAYGYTAVTEMMVDKDSNLHKALIELADENRLLIKCQPAYVVSPRTRVEDLKKLEKRNKRINGKLVDDYYAKIFIDGVVESATAWLKEEYSNRPGFYGEPLWEDEKLFETCAALDKMGYDIHFHVIGDRAVSQMIDAVEHVLKVNGDKPRRYVAAHVQIMDMRDISRLRNAGVSVSANPYWFFKDEVYSVLNEFPMLGERAEEQYPMKSLIDAGITVSAGSDFNITPDPNPLYAMKFGMQRVAADAEAGDERSALNIKECVGFEEMLKCVTFNGAYTMNINELTGTLEAGKLADMVVLDKNIFDEKCDKFYDAKVLMTISEGQIVYGEETDL